MNAPTAREVITGAKWKTLMKKKNLLSCGLLVSLAVLTAWGMDNRDWHVQV